MDAGFTPNLVRIARRFTPTALNGLLAVRIRRYGEIYWTCQSSNLGPKYCRNART